MNSLKSSRIVIDTKQEMIEGFGDKAKPNEKIAELLELRNFILIDARHCKLIIQHRFT
jgi:hypothetical protein